MVRKAIFGAVIGLGLVAGPTLAYSQPLFGFTLLPRTSVGTPYFEATARNFFRTVNAPRAAPAAIANTQRVFTNLIGSGFLPTSPGRWGLNFS